MWAKSRISFPHGCLSIVNSSCLLSPSGCILSIERKETQMRDIETKLAVARGERPADLVLKNGRIVNVLSGEIHDGDVAVHDGRIVGIGRYEGNETVDLAGAYLAPGFIDAHIHLESTMLTVPEFTRAVVPRGTAAVVVDPHEFANVAGAAGIDYVLDMARRVPLDIFVMVSSCVPATPLETAGATLSPADMAPFLDRQGVAGIAEMMNFPGVFLGWKSELDKLALGKGRIIDGHAPGLQGPGLDAYVLAGIRSDHECTSREEALEKLRRGMQILVREGTAERNLHELLPLITPFNVSQFSFSTDDKHPGDLMDEGHIDHHVRESIAWGLDPIRAFQMATINTARHYRLRNLGAIAPRYWANLVSFTDLSSPHPDRVWRRGVLVAEKGEFLGTLPDSSTLPTLGNTMHVAPLDISHVRIPVSSGSRIRVIDLIPRQIVTRASTEVPTCRDGEVVADPERDLLKLFVIERHHATGNVGIGIVRGFGMKRGALGSTVAHDAHNIIVVGVDDTSILTAALTLVRMGGGQCVVDGEEVVGALPLPVAGLVSDRPLAEVRRSVDALCAASASLGTTVADPFMVLSFLALSPIPELKVTDLGLVDAVRFERTSLFVD